MKVLEIDVSQFADICGDNICQEGYETLESCPQDCFIPSPPSPSSPSPLSAPSASETLEEKTNYLPFIGIFILLLVFIISIFLIKKKKEKKKEKKSKTKSKKEERSSEEEIENRLKTEIEDNRSRGS